MMGPSHLRTIWWHLEPLSPQASQLLSPTALGRRTYIRQARGSTRAYAQVHRRLPHGHQGIRHTGPHHREAACFMGPHVQLLACLGASVLTPAPHSLCTAAPLWARLALWPMHHIGGLCMCRADQWLAIGLHTIQWTTEAWLAAAGHTSHGVGCRLA